MNLRQTDSGNQRATLCLNGGFVWVESNVQKYLSGLSEESYLIWTYLSLLVVVLKPLFHHCVLSLRSWTRWTLDFSLRLVNTDKNVQKILQFLEL